MQECSVSFLNVKKEKLKIKNKKMMMREKKIMRQKYT
jgi:hypothetical protein